MENASDDQGGTPVLEPKQSTKDPTRTTSDQDGTNEVDNKANAVEKPILKGPGVAMIKAEYINHDHKMRVSEYLPQHLSEQIQASRQDAQKRPAEDAQGKIEGEPANKKNRVRGRFKNSKRGHKKTKAAEKLCPAIKREEECQFGDKCKFSHDIQAYVKSNPSRSDKPCFNYMTFGECPYGVTCVFSASHLTPDLKNIKNEDLVTKFKSLPPRETNGVTKTLGYTLSRRKFDFTLSDSLHKVIKEGKIPDSSKYMTKRPDWMRSKQSEPTPSIGKIENKTVVKTVTEDLEGKPKIVLELEKNGNEPLENDESGEIGQCSDKVTEEGHTHSNIETVTLDSETETKNAENNGLDEKQMKVEISTPTTLLDSEGIRLRPQEKKKVDFRDKLYLAPLTTVGNLPFRRVCKEYGVDITCSEMATTAGLLQGRNSEWALMKRHQSEDVFGAQVCGSHADVMSRCTQLLMEQTDIDFLDINLGCPIDLFFKKGEGCALMGKPTKLVNILNGMSPLMNVPLTVKMRTGIFENKPIATSLIQKIKEETDVSLITVHGRSREQRYTRQADWKFINECCKIANPLPIVGGGDIMSYSDYKLRMTETGVTGCMIARGALIKPWVFTEIKEQRDWDISSSERLEMLRRFSNYGLEHWGSDAQGVATTRKFLLEWLSFLHRYIPVGLLERPPQRINEKPPPFMGRDDLETLMGSRNCDDWVKISEMLLGPVPDDFEFVPKHKANAYN